MFNALDYICKTVLALLILAMFFGLVIDLFLRRLLQ